MPASGPFEATRTDGTASHTPIRCWQVQSSATASGTGEEISDPSYDASGWYVAPPRSTVLAALLANGLYPDIERSTRMADVVDPELFAVPWWFRSQFVVGSGDRVTIRLDGVIHRGDLYVNGTAVADSTEIAGAYTVHAFDVTDLVRPGTNALAIRVHPGSPLTDLSIGWVDWNQWPPDNNMGVWRDVVVERTGAVRCLPPLVTSQLSPPSADEAAGAVRAELSLRLGAENLTASPVEATVVTRISGHGLDVTLDRTVNLPPGEVVTLELSPADEPQLAVEEPALWWPVGEGSQPLYDLSVSTASGGLTSDRRETTFGIRTVTSDLQPGGGGRFAVNGRPLQLLGGGWCPDLFLRHDTGRIEAELGYAVDLGLNMIRLEGKLENPEFFDTADRLGLLVLAGWECCNKWEGEKGTQGADWVEEDYGVAARSMASEAVLLRNHASVAAFLIGSDFAPPPRTASIYVQALEAAGWSVPVVSAATVEGTEAAGPSGMKMTGPYAWVPPGYWYSKDEARGGAVGFNSESGAGGNIPRLPSLERMLSPEDLDRLWREPTAKHFHAGPPSEFDNLAIFARALAGRYGAPKDLEDFVRKAQLANYEAARAQFEAYSAAATAERPATGLVYWMFNSAWPSLNWQLHDWYLDPAGAYFGVKTALEWLHLQYAYDTGDVVAVNHRPDRSAPVDAEWLVRDLSGAVVAQGGGRAPDGVPDRGAVTLGHVELPPGMDRTYFLELRPTDAEQPGAPGRNVYWLSTAPDELDWADTSWQYTPASSFADLTGLERLGTANVEASAGVAAGSGRATISLRVRNASPGGTPAVGLHASMVDLATGRPVPVAPVTWSQNVVTLFAEDEAELVAHCAEAPGRQLGVQIDGFNLGRSLAVDL